MQEPAAFAVLAHRDFRYFLISRFLSAFSLFMVGVAVGWQVYDLTHDPMALGFVGLAQFLPAFLLTLPGGLAADRFDRRRVLLAGYLLELTVAVLFLLMTHFSVGKIGIIYAVVALIGVGRAILTPASLSLVPVLVPQEQLVRAVAWSSSAFQTAMIAGPAVGGFLYALGPIYVYSVAVFFLVIASYLAIRLKVKLLVHSASSVGINDLFAGVKYVFERKVILGAVSLDLFAVLFGGATALLPVYAADILHVGPWGLGLLRSAPAVGAAAMALWMAHHPVKGKAGMRMFVCVALFGVFTTLFGVSRWFPLSLLALFGLGAVDMVSVVVRHTLVQLATPDEMRGRVSAATMLFVGASNELGEFESGMTASWFGTVASVVIGGLGTLVVVGIWAFGFPALRKLDRLEDIKS
ncbi:MAG: MFS transporter [Opitutaceae bacterium]|jgi:MFS family permease